MENNGNELKKILEWLSKGFVYLAPILIGFFGMTAYNSLRETITRKKFFGQLGVSIAVSMGVYELLKLWPKLEPATGFIVGACSAFSLIIVDVLITNLPGMLRDLLKSVLGIMQKKLENNPKDNANNNP